jgi:uncharacterized MAPEG superfamily protein
VGRIGQVLANLLSNALRHTPSGGRIEVSVARGERVIAVSVEDSGPGIPPEEREKVFERYYRVQMNTLELLVVLLPALPLFAYYVSVRWATVLGLVYLVGRLLYFFAYVKDPAKRGPGYVISYLPVVVLLVGGLGAAALAALRG